MDEEEQPEAAKTPSKRAAAPSSPKQQKKTPSSTQSRSSKKKKRKDDDMDVETDQPPEDEKEGASATGLETPKQTAKSKATTPKSGTKKKNKRTPSISSEKEPTSIDEGDDKMEIDETLGEQEEKTVETSPEKAAKDQETPKDNSKKSRKKASASKKRDDSTTPKREKASPKTVSGQKRKKEGDTNKESSQHKPTLDVYIHRLRHLHYHPAAVTAMAATNQDGYVAVARQDGSFQLKVLGVLEEFRSKYIPHLVTVSEIQPPIVDSPALVANSLCWVETAPNSSVPPTCVAASPTGNLWIVDFERSQMVSAIHSGGGGVFDVVTCGGNHNVTGAHAIFSLPMFAAACQDGSVRIWKIANNQQDVAGGGDNRDAIVDPPLVTVPSMGAPILSVAWKLCGRKEMPRKHSEDESSSVKSTIIQTVLFAAVADGTIRKYSIDLVQHDYGDLELQRYQREKSPQSEYSVDKVKSILRMSVESKGRRTATKVWSLNSLDDGTLVAGNSLGQVQFWNSHTGTLQQTVLQTSLQADVLKIVANDKGTKVFCSGVDSRVVCIERPAKTTGGSTQWKLTHVQRPHSHDVKAMVLLPAEEYNQKSKVPRRLETLISGGVDTKLCSYMVSAFGAKRPQAWLPWPMHSPISTSSNPSPPRLLSMQRRDRVELYELEKLPTNPLEKKPKPDQLAPAEPHRQSVRKMDACALVGSIQIDSDKTNVSSRLLSSQLSPTGKFLAVSTGMAVLAFYLDRADQEDENTGSAIELKPVQITLPEAFRSMNATTLQFWGNYLYVGDSTKRQIHIVHLKMSDKEHPEATKFYSFSLPAAEHASSTELKLPIQSIEIGRNGKMLIVSSHTRDNAVHVFSREQDDGNYQLNWTLPKLGSYDARPAASIVVMKSKLAVATYQSHVYLFNIKEQRLSSWSEKHGFPIKSEKWTEDLICRKDFPVRLMENPKDRSQIIIVSGWWIPRARSYYPLEALSVSGRVCQSCEIALFGLRFFRPSRVSQALDGIVGGYTIR
jgi:hypothetical protein